jgi:hypothetical protein
MNYPYPVFDKYFIQSQSTPDRQNKDNSYRDRQDP